MTLIIGGAAVSVLAMLVVLNQRRANSNWSFELKPNCLLTRYPLLFISGPRSLLYFRKYWNQIPHFLSSHGYEVMELSLPWRNRALRQEHLNRFIAQAEALGMSLHIIGDAACVPELQKLAAQRSSAVHSCSLITSGQVVNQSSNAKPRPEELRPLQYQVNEVHLPGTQLLAPAPSLFWRLLIQLHNWVTQPEQGLDPVTVAIPQVSDPQAVAHHYLNLAISLAESDLKCSH